MNLMNTLTPKSLPLTAITFGATGTASLMTGNILRTKDKIQGDLTTMTGKISVDQSSVAGKATTISGDINIVQSAISGEVSTMSGNVDVINQSKVGPVSTKNGDIIVDEDSAAHGDVTTANGRIMVSKSTVNGDVKNANGLVTILESTVNGNVSGKNQIPKIQNSTITGQLTLNSKIATMKNSKIGSIQVEKNTNSGNVSFISDNNGIFIGGNIVGGSISGSQFNFGNVIQLGVGSTCNINGYNIQPNSGSQTTLITPEGFIYVNGDQVYGDGPETYAAYKKQNPKAPSFSAPGWQDQGFKKKDEAAAANPAETAKPKEPDQVIYLEGNTTIQGDITFESGNGKVVVGAGSTILGKVVGGIVENQ